MVMDLCGGVLRSTPFFIKRLALAIVSRLADRRLAYALAIAAVLSAKLLHVYAHLDALATDDLLRWGVSFFAQDTVFLIILRLLIDAQPSFRARWLRIVAKVAAASLVGFVTLLASISSSFLVAGLELHWHNIGTAGDSSAWKMLLTGLVSLVLVFGALIFLAGMFQGVCYVAGMAIDILKWPISAALGRLPMLRRLTNALHADYKRLSQRSSDGLAENGLEDKDVVRPDLVAPDSPPPSPSPVAMPPKRVMVLLYFLVGVALLAQALTTILRPSQSSFTFMSWTLPLFPFVDFAHSSPSLGKLINRSGSTEASSLQNRTALAEPVHFAWLPKDTPLPGFEDWYEPDGRHYCPDEDPLKKPASDDLVLSGLERHLEHVPIRHVMLIKLETTRKDVFPVRKNDLIWDSLARSFSSKMLPQAARERLATLTPTANFLTGDYDDGFEHREGRRRGGINFNNAHTTSTYTLKSLTGTICGLTPLVVDFNAEFSNHIYQPCLPQIFYALNQVARNENGSAIPADDFRSFPWKTAFMQSVTKSFDKQDSLMSAMGFPNESIVTKEYLKSGEAKFGQVNLTDINYFGLPEIALEDYIRDAFATAKASNERLFLTHLTSTTHHDFGLPEGESYVPLAGDKELDDLSHYTNAVGSVDRWLGRVLDILEQQGVSNETLLVLVGDHGISIAEQGSVSTYANGNIGNFHVPLVISHPKLPPIDVNDAVISLQVLPTILDLLAETGSLSPSETQAARDLAQIYEGRSLIRPVRTSPVFKGAGDWQFTLINPGGSIVSVRDARQPNWRLIVPIVANNAWRFTDLTSNPHEVNSTVSFDFNLLLEKVRGGHGDQAASWVEDAASATSWLVEDNMRRWRYMNRR